MITIFHGINSPASRKAFIHSRVQATNPVTLEGTKITLTDLAQVLTGEALFAKEKFLFIEEFFSKRKQSKETDALITFLNENNKDNNIFIWESKELTTKQLNAYKSVTVQKFDLPKHIFAFLDALLPNNSKTAMTYFHKVLETEEPEFVFFMMVRHIRILLALNNNVIPTEAGIYSNGSPIRSGMTENDTPEQIDEIKRMAPWQKNKLTKQANMFPTNYLLKFYNDLFTIEKGLKTGSLVTSLVEAIDFLLIKL